MSIKGQERLNIIAEFIKTGECREGYKIIETKSGGYIVRKILTNEEKLVRRRDLLLKKLQDIENRLGSSSDEI